MWENMLVMLQLLVLVMMKWSRNLRVENVHDVIWRTIRKNQFLLCRLPSAGDLSVCDMWHMCWCGTWHLSVSVSVTSRNCYNFTVNCATHTHAHMHTHAFSSSFSGTTQVSRYQTGKPIWVLLKQETVSGSGISWAVCKFAPRSRQITMPAPHHSVFYRPGALFANSYKF